MLSLRRRIGWLMLGVVGLAAGCGSTEPGRDTASDGSAGGEASSSGDASRAESGPGTADEGGGDVTAGGEAGPPAEGGVQDAAEVTDASDGGFVPVAPPDAGTCTGTTWSCTPDTFCAYVSQNGRVDVSQCLTHPSGCDTCACETAAVSAYYWAHFHVVTPGCYCFDSQGANVPDAGGATRLVSCMGA